MEKNGGRIRLVLWAPVFSGVRAPFYILGGVPLDRSIALPVPFVLLCLPSPVMAVSKHLGSFGWFIAFSGL